MKNNFKRQLDFSYTLTKNISENDLRFLLNNIIPIESIEKDGNHIIILNDNIYNNAGDGRFIPENGVEENIEEVYVNDYVWNSKTKEWECEGGILLGYVLI